MAEYTENYNLTKQGDNEYVGIDVMNDNLDIIDQAIAEAGNNPQLEIDVAEIKDKIGSTADTGGSSTVGSVFAKLNYLVSQVSSYLSGIYDKCMKIGVESDVGETTIFGMLRNVLNKKQKFIKVYTIEFAVPASATDAIALQVAGPGTLYSINCNKTGKDFIKQLKISYDGGSNIYFSDGSSTSYVTAVIRPFFDWVSGVSLLNVLGSSFSEIKHAALVQYNGIEFNESLVIKASNGATSESIKVRMIVGLYE